MFSTWDEMLRSNGVTADEVRRLMPSIPREVAEFLDSAINPFLSSGKIIDAFKAIRAKYNIDLRTAKAIIDVYRDPQSAQILDVLREERAKTAIQSITGNPSLVDAVELMENSCRGAIRHAKGNEKALAALLGMRAQISELWLSLTAGS